MNRIESMKPTNMVLYAGVIAAMVVLSRTDWISSAIYHDAHSIWSVIWAVSVLFCGVALLLVLFGSILPSKASRFVFRFLFLIIGLYILQAPLRQLPFLPSPLTAMHKAVAIVVGCGLAISLATHLGAAFWRRLSSAMIVAGLLYSFSPWVLVQFMAPHVKVRLKADGLHTESEPTAILLLDELGADHAGPIERSLLATGAHVEFAAIPAVGKDTITVVPEIFGSAHIPSARVCTLTAVCDAEGVFDFRKLAFSPADRFHLVGFFHPYCQSSGWASCVTFRSPQVTAIKSLICSFVRLIPFSSVSLGCNWMDPETWVVFRASMIESVNASSFWSTGGVLYAHLPLPHPPGSVVDGTLAQDYKANVDLAAQVVSDVWQKGVAVHGKKFKLIVLSDHPLRPELWCRHAKYAKSGCAMEADAKPRLVPFLVVTSNGAKSTFPGTNAELFSIIK